MYSVSLSERRSITIFLLKKNYLNLTLTNLQFGLNSIYPTQIEMQTYPILLFCGREGIKSVVTDLVYAFGSSSNQEAGSVIDNETGTASSVLRETNINNTIVHGRRRSGFRRRGDTTTFQGPTGAPPLGTASMAGASGGGPAAWAAAAFGRGEERKVFRNYFI